MKQVAKKILKSKFTQKLVSFLIFIYMHIVHYTSRVRYIVPDGYDHDYYKNLKNSILVSWHDKIMILPHISPYKLHRNLHALVSPHNDGKIISDTMRLIGYKIIEGSSNKNSMAAVKNIIRTLKSGENVVITPDGPRGPRHEMKGNLIEIAKKCDSDIIAFTATASKYKKLKSWDKLIFPLPFGRIDVIFGAPIKSKGSSKITLSELADKLNELGAS